MKAELIELLCCLNCDGDLQLDQSRIQFSEIWEGALICKQCSSVYPIENGLPHLYIDDESWAPKAAEAAGWVSIHKDMGIYEVADEAVDLAIPYYPQEPWITVARSFNIALDSLALAGEETVLDLGSGRGWAAKQFSQRGCRVVAIDIVADENVGLGRAKRLMDDAGLYFDRVIGDGENLPFFADSFDLVFCMATMHHSSNLPLLCQNIHHVLKPGGKLYAIEPCISVVDNEQRVLARDAAQELELGINETRPSLIDYYHALQSQGLTIESVLPSHLPGHDSPNLISWAQDVGATKPRFSLLTSSPLRFTRQMIKFLGRRLIALQNGSLKTARAFMTSSNSQIIERAILLWGGGEIFIIAKKS